MPLISYLIILKVNHDNQKSLIFHKRTLRNVYVIHAQYIQTKEDYFFKSTYIKRSNTFQRELILYTDPLQKW